MADSQVAIDKIGIPGAREQKAIHRAAWAQAKSELNSLLHAVVPAGGATDQVLTKRSAAAYDFGWDTPSGGGGGGSVPAERIRPEDFGYTGSGDASTAVQSAISSCQGTRDILWLSNIYPVNDLVATASLRVDGGGSLIPQAEPTNPLLAIRIPAVFQKTVSAITTTTVDLSEGDGITSATSRLTCNNVTNLAVGQLVRVTSEDTNPAPNGVTNYYARNAMIISISGSFVYLDGVLPAVFTTNVKLWVYDDAQQRTSIKNILFDVTKANAWSNDWSFPFLEIEGAISPEVHDSVFRNITAAGIDLGGNVGSDIASCSFLEGRNRTDLGIAGYGVQSRAGYLDRIRNCYFRNVRHGITTIGPTTVGNETNPFKYGGTFGMIGDSCSANGCGANAYDTHSDAVNCGFTNCLDDGGWAGHDAADAGFQLRGDQCFVVNGQVTNRAYGVSLYNHSANESTRPHIVNGLKARVRIAGLRLRPTQRIKGICRDLDIESSGDRTVDLGNCEVQIINILSRITGSSGFAHIIQNPSAAGAVCKIEGGTFDSTGTTGTNGAIYKSTGTGHIVSIDGKILSTSGQGWRAAVDTSDGSDLTALFNVEADRASSNSNGTNNLGSGSVWLGRVRVDGGRTSDNSTIAVTSTGGNRTLSEHVNSRAEAVVIAFNCTTADTTINVATASLLKNQRVHVINRTGSTFNLILKNDSANKLAMQSDRTLAPGAGATLVWNPTDAVFNLASSPLSGASGITGIDIQIDGVAALSNQTVINFEADDFTVTGGQVLVDSSIARNAWAADQNAADHVLQRPLFLDTADTEQSASSSAGAITLNQASGNIVKTTQNENITAITISNLGTGGWIQWEVTRTGTHTITWPASFRWVGNTVPTLSGSGFVDKFFIEKRGALYDVSYEQGYPST